MSFRKFSLLGLGLTLVACATHATPESAQMANALCDQGKTLLSSGKTSEARDVYSSAIARNEDDARAWNGLGVANDLMGKREEAKIDYQHAVALAPNDLNMVNNLAHLSLETGNYDDTITLLEKHSHDVGATAPVRQNLAEAYGVSGREAEAEALLHIDLPPAQVAQRLMAFKKLARDHESYADLGSYPTDGIAQAHISEAKKAAGDAGSMWVFAVVPDIKVTGGTPVFTVRITGQSPQTICDLMNAQALPCIPHGK